MKKHLIAIKVIVSTQAIGSLFFNLNSRKLQEVLASKK
jgi:hypothetical protein